MARKPVGTNIRLAPDWFVTKAAWGQGQVTRTSAGFFIGIELYNNSNDGSYFYLYGLQVDEFASVQLYGWVSAGAFGTLFKACYPIVADQGQPFGVVNTTQSLTALDTINIPYTWQGGQPTAPIMSPWPIMVIPPGWSFKIASGDPFDALIATFWYTIIPSKN